LYCVQTLILLVIRAILNKYIRTKRCDLGAASAVQRSLAALEQKEMIFKEINVLGSRYQVMLVS